MTRTDKGKSHRRIGSIHDKGIDKEFMFICKRADWIKKVQKIMNTIKANGMYSDREMNLDLENMQLLNIPDYERDVLVRAWEFRVEQTKLLCKELSEFMERCKKIHDVKL